MKREATTRAPLAIGITPASGPEPGASVWDREAAHELAAIIEHEVVSREDVLVLVARDLPTTDLAHVLRELAAVIEHRELRECPFTTDLRPRGRRETLARSA